MKLYEPATIIIISVVVVLGVVGYMSSRYLGNDNAIEEGAEDAIEAITGVDIDLTPYSPEN
jgi:hypothetical protein